MQGGQGEAAWEGAFILAVTNCENENVSSFIDMDTRKWMQWTLHQRRVVECLSAVRIWPSTGNCSCTFIHRVHLVTSCFSKREKGGWGRVTVPLTHLLGQSAKLKRWRWHGLFKAHGESHLPSVALWLGFVLQQRSNLVLTVLSNCYPVSSAEKKHRWSEQFSFPTYN